VGHRTRDPENGVRTQSREVSGPVALDERPVDSLLGGRVPIDDYRREFLPDALDRPADAPAAVALAPIAAFDGLVGAGARARWDGKNAPSVAGFDGDPNGGIAPRVEHLPGVDGRDSRPSVGVSGLGAHAETSRVRET